MMHSATHKSAAIVAILLFFLTNQATAKVHADYGVVAGYSNISNSEDNPPALLSNSASYASGSDNDASNAYVLAQYGILKARGDASASGYYQISSSSSYSSFYDAVTISNPVLNGKIGYLTATLLYNDTYSYSAYGAKDAFASASSSFKVFANIPDASLFLPTFISSSNANVSEGGSINCTASVCSVLGDGISVNTIGGSSVLDSKPGISITAKLPFIFGSSFDLGATLTTSAIAHSGAGGSAFSATDASHSLYWGGIPDVRDASGTSVSFSLVSDTGIDWRRSFVPTVPEPSSPAMLLSGGLVLLGSVRRKRKA